MVFLRFGESERNDIFMKSFFSYTMFLYIKLINISGDIKPDSYL